MWPPPFWSYPLLFSEVTACVLPLRRCIRSCIVQRRTYTGSEETAHGCWPICCFCKGEGKEPITRGTKFRKFYAWPPPPVLMSFACFFLRRTFSYIESNSVFQMYESLFLYCLITTRKDVCKVCQWRKEAKCSSHTSIYLQVFPAGVSFHQVGSHVVTFRRDASRERCVLNINMCTYFIISGLLLLLFRPPDPKIYTRLPAKREIKLESPNEQFVLKHEKTSMRFSLTPI